MASTAALPMGSRAAKSEAEALFVLVRSGRDTAESIRATIAVSERDRAWLSIFVPSKALELIEFREAVLAEFDRLVAGGDPAPIPEPVPAMDLPIVRAVPQVTIDPAAAEASRLEAERAWEEFLTAAQQGRGFQEFDAPTQQAVRAAGGLGWVLDCPRADLERSRKRFIEAYGLGAVAESSCASSIASETVLR